MTEEVKTLEINISDELTDDDWKCIELFKKRANELIKTRILSELGSGISANITFKPQQPLIADVKLPHDDDLRAFFSIFRFFLLKEEPCNFFRVMNIIKRRARHDQVNQAMDNIKAQWTGENRRRVMSIKYNDRELTTEFLLKLWFNAHYFHSDENKMEELQQLNDLISDDFSKYLLSSAIYDAANAVLSLNKSIEMLERKKTA